MISTKDRVVALIDGDIVAVRAAAVSQGGDPDDIESACHFMIRDWTERAHADTCVVFVSEGKCFRYDVYPDYKGNRKDKPKPIGSDYAASYLQSKYKQMLSNPLLEADDRMGLYATEESDDVRIIVSADKDMAQVPCWYFRPDHMRFPVLNHPEGCERFLLEQWLCGDAVDGYRGLKTDGKVSRFGPKAFDTWYTDERDPDLGLVGSGLAKYEDIGHSVDTALGQLLCSTIKHNHLPPHLQPLDVVGILEVIGD